jgi:hypothetical protein
MAGVTTCRRAYSIFFTRDQAREGFDQGAVPLVLGRRKLADIVVQSTDGLRLLSRVADEARKPPDGLLPLARLNPFMEEDLPSLP